MQRCSGHHRWIEVDVIYRSKGKWRWGECGSREDEEARSQLLCNHGQLHGLIGNFKGASTTVFGVCQRARCWCRVNISDCLPYCFQNSTWSSSHLLWKTQWYAKYQLHRRKNIHSMLNDFTELLLKCKTNKKKRMLLECVKIHGQCIIFMVSLIKNEIPSFCNTQGFSLKQNKDLNCSY